MLFRRAVGAVNIQKQERGIIGNTVGIGIVIRDDEQPMNLGIEIHPKPIAIPTPIPTLAQMVYSIRPAVRGRRKPHLLGVVVYSDDACAACGRWREDRCFASQWSFRSRNSPIQPWSSSSFVSSSARGGPSSRKVTSLVSRLRRIV
jgi:hypothetical protein